MDTNIVFDLKNLLSKNIEKISQIEIEVKIKNGKSINISNLEEKLLSENYILEENFYIDYIYKNKRTTFHNSKYYNTSKNNIYTKFFKNYKLTVSIEEEEELISPSVRREISIPKYDIIRKKYRRSYKKDNFSIDITVVNEEKVEIEVEVIDAKIFDMKKLNKVLDMIEEQNSNIIEDFSKAMGRVEKDLNSLNNLFSKARDLEFKDLKKNGILKPFTISLKADGKTIFLYFHISGVYLVDINREKIEKIALKNDLVDCLYVGEIIKKENLKKDIKENFLFLPYDCLRYNNIDIRNLNYLIRFRKCESIYDLKFETIKIQKKDILTYHSNTESFNETVKKSFDNMKKVIYYTDGIIFTPIKSSYIAKGQYLRKSQKGKRNLSNFLDVLKYKKPEDLTIDLLIKEDGVYSSRGLFKSRDIFKFSDTDIGKIAEFKPFLEEGKIIYRVNRIREDKTFPNGIDVVETLWRLRKDPIELKTLEGQNTKLMRKYHNVIKKERIINKLSGLVLDIGSGVGGDLDKYLKNENIKDVLFVEPNVEFIEEFERRRSNLYLGNKNFHIIRAGGEETDKISEAFKEYILPKSENCDLHINMMISLSFFWKSKKMLNNLATTINTVIKIYKSVNSASLCRSAGTREGSSDNASLSSLNERVAGSSDKRDIYFNFLTIEGKRLENLFSEKGDSIMLNNIVLKRLGENEVFVDIEESKTVESQTEYFVYLENLFELIDFQINNLEEADGERKDDYILSLGEKTYSSLFVYGSAKYEDPYFNYEALEVSETKGEKIKGLLQAYGDDKKERLKRNLSKELNMNNLYRIAVMKKEGSLNHALLKLFNESYRNSDIYDRKKTAKKLNIKNFDKIPYKVNVLSKDGIETFNDDKKEIIYLLKNKEDIYEPIVRIENGKIERIF